MKKLIYKILKIFTLGLSLFNALMFFAMRPCWSGISKTLGYEDSLSSLVLNLPLIVMGILVLILLSHYILSLIFKEKKVITFIYLGIDIIFFAALMVIIALGALDYMLYIWRNFLYSLIFVALILVLYFFLKIYPNIKLKDSKLFKIILISCSALASVGILVKFSINYMTYEPVVWAVEDEYQIVFSSSSNSLGWIEINNEKYYDTFAGSQKSFTKVHKVIVPMEKLDSAKNYTIKLEQVIYRGPFGGLLGGTISKNYNFRPVDSSDGLNYFNLSDVHLKLDNAIKAASGDSDMDFLVIAGDVASYVQTESDANLVNKLAFAITKGEIPCIYSRGNHEVKGEYAEQLYKYVGSKNQKFYYNFYFNDVYGINLDLGEDHDDDWWEYYTTANYDSYRKEQLEFIKEENNKKNYLNYKYKLGVCHIPPVYINSRGNHVDIKKAWNEELNKMSLDMMISGHQHELYIFDPNIHKEDTKLTYNKNYKTKSGGKIWTTSCEVVNFNYPNLLVSKPGNSMSESNNKNGHIGMKVVVDKNFTKEEISYINSKKEEIDFLNAYAEISYGKKLTINLLTKEFSNN